MMSNAHQSLSKLLEKTPYIRNIDMEVSHWLVRDNNFPGASGCGVPSGSLPGCDSLGSNIGSPNLATDSQPDPKVASCWWHHDRPSTSSPPRREAGHLQEKIQTEHRKSSLRGSKKLFPIKRLWQLWCPQRHEIEWLGWDNEFDVGIPIYARRFVGNQTSYRLHKFCS